jgi:uncharacterized membrane protein
MNGYSGPLPYGRGFGGGLLGPEHAGSAAHPLEWAIFALVLVLLLFALANLALALAARRGRRWWRPAVAGGAKQVVPPVEVLSSRYARGQIGRDEFLQALDDLRGSAAPPPPPEDEPTAEQPPG